MENALKAVDDVAEAWRRDRRELKDEVNWLHSELHGAEMEAERLRKKPATPPPARPDEPPYDLLIDLLRDEWGIEACWDGLRRFWHIGLTEGEVRVREALEAENTRLRSCLSDTEEHASMFLWENKQLEEERDKLRELVQDMHHFILLCGDTRLCGIATPDKTLDVGTFEQRMEELGVKV